MDREPLKREIFKELDFDQPFDDINRSDEDFPERNNGQTLSLETILMKQNDGRVLQDAKQKSFLFSKANKYET